MSVLTKRNWDKSTGQNEIVVNMLTTVDELGIDKMMEIIKEI